MKRTTKQNQELVLAGIVEKFIAAAKNIETSDRAKDKALTKRMSEAMKNLEDTHPALFERMEKAGSQLDSVLQKINDDMQEGEPLLQLFEEAKTNVAPHLIALGDCFAAAVLACPSLTKAEKARFIGPDVRTTENSRAFANYGAANIAKLLAP